MIKVSDLDENVTVSDLARLFVLEVERLEDSKSRIENAIRVISELGGLPDHNKGYVLDQTLRALCGGLRLDDWNFSPTLEYFETITNLNRTYDEGVAP